MNRDIIDDLQRDWSEQRPDLDPVPMGVVLRIQALAKILGEQAAVTLEDFGLQWWQYDALSALRRQGPPFRLPATQLAEATMLTSGAMTNRIDRLEESGLVRRLRDRADRRKVLVELTPKGVRLVDRASEARFDIATGALEHMSEPQKTQLNKLLRVLLAAQPQAPEPDA
jgi:DNA-binding MarR family transcriptional regulator